MLKRPRKGKKSGETIHIGNPWHAVAIRSGADRCPAAMALATRRFLSGEAPLVPLPACNRPHACRCVYRHFDDRRSGPRRASDDGRMMPPFHGREQRRSGGRRATDHAPSRDHPR